MSGYTKVGATYNDTTYLNNEDVVAKTESRTCTLYTRRWLILLLFVLYTTSNVMQWIQYSVIADVVVKYYGVSYTTVDWTSTMFLLCYIIFSFPGSYILDKMGLRKAVLIGMAGTCLGAWIKVASVSPDRFWVILLSQSILGFCNVLVLPVPPKLAAVWFGSKEVSTACSIGVFAVEVGIAVGYLVPPLVVGNDEDSIQNGFFIMSLAIAIVTSVLLLLLIAVFQDAPPTPPSIAQLKLKEKSSESFNFFRSVKNIVRNPSYMLLLTSYGINIGLLSAIGILLNQIVLEFHPNAGVDVGFMGLVIVFSSMVGSIVSGIILDKFNRYKETTLAIYALSLATMILFTFAIRGSIEMVYLVLVPLGFSVVGVITVGLELGVELTYPEPEGTSSGLLTTSTQVFGIVFTYLYSYLFHTVGDIWTNVTMCITLVLGIILIACIKNDLRRQKAQMVPLEENGNTI